MLLGLFSLGALAEHEQVQMKVKGMVCAFCAQGILKKLQAEKGVSDVKVSLEDHLVTFRLQDQTKVSDEHFKEVLKNAFEPMEELEDLIKGKFQLTQFS